MILQYLRNNLTHQKQEDREAELYRNLIRHEARIGGQLFGPVRPGGRREFFCLDEHTWVWHEEWIDEQGQPQVRTTRYDVRPTGVLKVQDGHYQAISRTESQHLLDAIQLYEARVTNELYQAAVV